MIEMRDLRIGIGERNLVTIDHLAVAAGERLGLVGESGSGKTLTVMSILGLLPHMMSVTGSITFEGHNLLETAELELAKVRGRDIAMVFQDPGRSLNPTMRIGRQVGETLKLHTEMSRKEIRVRVIELLDSVKLPQPEKLIYRYPHELSGGQQQRVMIAMAIACKPKLLIADEPTTALDVTVQKGVLELLLQLSQESDMSLIFVSHNLGVVQMVSDRIAVMYRGQIVEIGPTNDIIHRPQHPYTKSLIAANPRIPDAEELMRLAGTHFTIEDGI